jgi:hypothetical protein
LIFSFGGEQFKSGILKLTGMDHRINENDYFYANRLHGDIVNLNANYCFSD